MAALLSFVPALAGLLGVSPISCSSQPAACLLSLQTTSWAWPLHPCVWRVVEVWQAKCLVLCVYIVLFPCQQPFSLQTSGSGSGLAWMTPKQAPSGMSLTETVADSPMGTTARPRPLQDLCVNQFAPPTPTTALFSPKVSADGPSIPLSLCVFNRKRNVLWRMPWSTVSDSGSAP